MNFEEQIGRTVKTAVPNLPEKIGTIVGVGSTEGRGGKPDCWWVILDGQKLRQRYHMRFCTIGDFPLSNPPPATKPKKPGIQLRTDGERKAYMRGYNAGLRRAHQTEEMPREPQTETNQP